MGVGVSTGVSMIVDARTWVLADLSKSSRAAAKTNMAARTCTIESSSADVREKVTASQIIDRTAGVRCS